MTDINRYSEYEAAQLASGARGGAGHGGGLYQQQLWEKQHQSSSNVFSSSDSPPAKDMGSGSWCAELAVPQNGLTPLEILNEMPIVRPMGSWKLNLGSGSKLGESLDWQFYDSPEEVESVSGICFILEQFENHCGNYDYYVKSMGMDGGDVQEVLYSLLSSEAKERPGYNRYTEIHDRWFDTADLERHNFASRHYIQCSHNSIGRVKFVVAYIQDNDELTEVYLHAFRLLDGYPYWRSSR